jgi:YidC/Oxa1 family membrane protein insertase
MIEIMEPSTINAKMEAVVPNEGLSSSPLIESIQKIGDLKSLGLCNNTPVGLLERLFESIYVTTGLPWWGVLATSTVAVRLLVLPILIKVQRNALIIQSIRPQLNDLQNAIKVKRENKDYAGMKKKMDEMKLLLKSNNASMATSFLGLVQVCFQFLTKKAPIFISFYFAIKKMAELPVPGFETSGLLWFTNLAIPDPYTILPVLSAVCVYTATTVRDVNFNLLAFHANGRLYSWIFKDSDDCWLHLNALHNLWISRCMFLFKSG